jgi:hypothetical protein
VLGGNKRLPKPKAKAATLEQGGNLHVLKYLEGKEEEDFPEQLHRHKAGGLQSQRRHQTTWEDVQ